MIFYRKDLSIIKAFFVGKIEKTTRFNSNK